MSRGRFFERLAGVVAALPVVLLVKDCVGDVVYTSGVSMQPTINPYPDQETLRKYYFSRYIRDAVLVEKVSTRSGRYERGSVVVLRSSEDPSRLLMKRLVALEGDWVINKRGDYVHVPKGHCWVEGDNHEHSIDSNDFGSVPLALVLARATHIVFPPWRMQKLAVEEPEEMHRKSKVHSRPYQFESIGIEQIVEEDSDEVKDEKTTEHSQARIHSGEEEADLEHLLQQEDEIDMELLKKWVENGGKLDIEDVERAKRRADPDSPDYQLNVAVDHVTGDTPQPEEEEESIVVTKLDVVK